MKSRNSPSKAAWLFSFPVNEAGNVMTNAISAWQKILQEVKNPSSNRAFVDFKRDVCITNKCGGEEKEIELRIKKIVTQAGYAERDKIKLEAWLSNYGGQDMSRFIDLLFNEGCFTEDGINIGSSYPITVNWVIEEGKIVLNYDIFINTLVYGVNGGLITAENGAVKKIDDYEIFSNKEIEYTKNNKKIPPLMRIAAKIKLEINKNEVTPELSQLTVESYSNYFQSPQIPTQLFLPLNEIKIATQDNELLHSEFKNKINFLAHKNFSSQWVWPLRNAFVQIAVYLAKYWEFDTSFDKGVIQAALDHITEIKICADDLYAKAIKGGCSKVKAQKIQNKLIEEAAKLYVRSHDASIGPSIAEAKLDIIVESHAHKYAGLDVEALPEFKLRAKQKIKAICNWKKDDSEWIVAIHATRQEMDRKFQLLDALDKEINRLTLQNGHSLFSSAKKTQDAISALSEKCKEIYQSDSESKLEEICNNLLKDKRVIHSGWAFDRLSLFSHPLNKYIKAFGDYTPALTLGKAHK